MARCFVYNRIFKVVKIRFKRRFDDRSIDGSDLKKSEKLPDFFPCPFCTD